MKALFKKEFSFYFNNPLGYIVLVLFGIFANFLYVKDIFVYGSASLRPFYEILPWLFLVFIPAISMRLFAEERRTNTIEVLLSLPISEMQIILAKFLASLAVVAVGLLLTVGLPISMYVLTQQIGVRIYLPEVFVGYVGSLLFASSFIAISMFFSVKTKNQIVAFLSSIIALFFLIIFSTDFAASALPRILQETFNYLSPVTQLETFIKGILDARSIMYFLSFSGLFLFLTVVDLEKRK